MIAPVRLRADTLVEPLVNQWYAWSYLIPPLSAAMYVTNGHIKMMESFLANPQIHAAALADPGMAGGPFLNLPAAAAPAVRALLDRTRSQHADLVELAEAVRLLRGLLSAEARGASLEPLYERVPAPLRGLIELVYDLEDRPAFRVFERLLYRSAYYKRLSQSVELRTTRGDSRPFSLSTPRVSRERGVHIAVPFDSLALDDLYRLRTSPAALEPIAERLGVSADQLPALRELCEPVGPVETPETVAAGIVFRYLGHACVLVRTPDVCILFDPVIPHGWTGSAPRCTYRELPAIIDYVVLTHNHQDHCMLETLLELRHRIGTVVVPRSRGGTLEDPSLRLSLQALGFAHVIELDAMESMELPGGELVALPFLGEHADLEITTKAGFAVRLSGRTALLLADSNNLDARLYDHIHNEIGDVDLVFIGMECDGAPMTWLYGPLFTRPISRKHDQSRRFTGSDRIRAQRIIERFCPSHVYVYAMGQEPWLGHVMAMRYTPESRPIRESDALVAACRERGIIADRLYGQRAIILEKRG